MPKLRTAVLAAVAAAALFPRVLAAQTVRVWEGELVLPTYALLPDDPNPQFRETDDSIVYPYSMQDNLGSERADRAWRAFFLENEYLKLACLPEIGGRIQWVFDKRRNEQMFYDNRVIRPGLIALRGAWISGGIEWNRGPQGHTVTSFSPVNVAGVENPDGSATLVIGEVEQTFRTGWEVRLTLRPGTARLDEEIRIFNPTDLPHPYYFWNNTAFPQRDGTRFVYPMSLASDHFGTTFYRFPEEDGVDRTRLTSYPEPTSLFAYRAVHDFFGAYDAGTDRGIVQTADHRELPGKKGWTWGQGDDGMMSQRALTDEDGPYIEVQSGPLPTQSDYAWLHPGQTVAWREEWTPVFGLGEGFEYATPELVVERVSSEAGTRFLFLAAEALAGARIRLAGGGVEHAVSLDLTPEAPASVEWPGDPDAALQVEVSVEGRKDGGERLVLGYRSPLEVPAREPPPLADEAEPATAEAAFQRGERAAKDLDRAEARRRYRQALALAPDHVGAAIGLSVLDLKAGRHEPASRRLARVAAAAPENGIARFLHGVARFELGDDRGALDSAFRATKLAGVREPAWRLVGRVRMRQGDPEAAIPAFRRGSPALLPLAWLAAGDPRTAGELADREIARGTVELVPWAVRLHLAEGEAERRDAAQAMRALAGEPEFAFTELLSTLAELGLPDLALEVFEGLREAGFAPGPVLWFHAAGWAAGERAERYREAALAAPLDYAFPSRPETLPVLSAAVEQLPASAAPRLLLGHLLGGLGRFEEAAAPWEAAAALEPGLSTAHRALAMFHWKIEGRKAAAESRLRQAVAARPEDQTLLRDLARLLLEQGRPAEAVEALLQVPAASPASGVRRRHDVTIELARALSATGRFAETAALLDGTEVAFREGDQTVWRLFSRAQVELGRRALAGGSAEAALVHFDRALTYPENLGVGRPHRPSEARALWFRAEALAALGRPAEAAATLADCAANAPTDEEQEHFIARCAATR